MGPPTASSPRICLTVGGQRFITTADTLKSLPDTRLGRLASDHHVTSQPEGELFFDRNPEIMNSLLDLYRTGELHLPKHLCGRTVAAELKFWEIPVELIGICCFRKFQQHVEDGEVIEEMDTFLSNPYESEEEVLQLSRWNRIWLLMELPGLGVNLPELNITAKIWKAVYAFVVLTSVLFNALETSMDFREIQPWFDNFTLSHYNTSSDALLPQLSMMDQYGISRTVPWLQHSLNAIFVFFVAEYLVRLLTCPSKREFLKQAKNCCDLFLVVQNGVSVLLEFGLSHKPMTADFSKAELDALLLVYSLSVLRVVRIFYLTKHLDTMKILVLSTRASLKVFLLLAISVLLLASLFGYSVFLAELFTSHYTFHSILYGMWYAIVTMTTVGYGDVVPAGWAGRLLGTLCALTGVIVIALPIAVIASKFTTYHDNLSSRQHRMTQLAFLKEHPGFIVRTGK